MRKNQKALSYCTIEQKNYINDLVNHNSTLTLRQLRKAFETKFNQPISLPTLAKFVDDFKYSVHFSVSNEEYRGKPETLCPK